MATAAQIKAESWWQREQVSPELKAFGARVRAHYGVPPSAFGTVGNTAHLVGRHRSLEWNLNSRYATRRNYGTRDRRDLDGNHRLIRAFDLSLPRSVLFEVSRNCEEACRDGRAYMLAEWYGDLGDDNTVDGWFEGRDSTSDNSHKTHLHGGLWTIYADDEQALNDLFAIMTGDDMPSWDDKIGGTAYGDRTFRQVFQDLSNQRDWEVGQAGDKVVNPPNEHSRAVKLDRAADKVLAVPPTQPVPVDVAALAAALAPHMEAAAEAAVRRVLGGVDGATPAAG